MYAPHTPSFKSSNSGGYPNPVPHPGHPSPSISSWGTLSTSQVPYAPGSDHSSIAPTQYPQGQQGLQPPAFVVVPPQLNPYLDCQNALCLNFDLGNPPMHTFNTESATHPVLQRMVVTFEGCPTWEFALQSPGALTVQQVLQQICQYLQGFNTPGDTQYNRMNPAPGYDAQISNGQTRIQALGQRRAFRGMSRMRNPNDPRWIVLLGAAPY